jgi:hypothetical protein
MRKLAIGVILGLLTFGGFVNHCQSTEPLFSGAEVVCAYSNITRIYSADFDGDSLPEYALVESIANKIEFIDYLANNTLSVVANLTITGRPYLLCPADFNNDGRVDFAIVSAASDSVIKVYVANGRYEYNFYTSIVANRAEPITQLFVDDIDRDGDNDILFLQDRIGICLNDGSGFQLPDYISDIYIITAINISDFNSDYSSDLIVVYGQRKIVKILINNGSGIFSDGPAASLPYTPTFATPAEFNCDGLIDLVISDNAASFTILISTGSNFLSPINTYCNRVPASLLCRDFDADNDIDIAFSSQYADSIYLFSNMGNGSFISQQKINLGFSTNNIMAADFDIDNDLDLLAINYDYKNVTCVYNNGDDSFLAATTYPSPGQPRCIISSNLNNDTFPDLAVANYDSNNVLLYQNNGNGVFQLPVSIPAGDGPRSVAASDIDGDDDNDLVVADYDSNKIAILTNDGSGDFVRTGSYMVATNPIALAIADYDNANGPDIALSSAYFSLIELLINDGAGSFPTNRFHEWTVHFSPLLPVDFDNDGDFDIAFGGMGAADVAGVIINNGLGYFDTTIVANSPAMIPSICIINLNNDSYPDLAVADNQPSRVIVFRNVSGAQLSAAGEYSRPYYPSSIRAADFDADGDQDLAVAEPARSCVTVMFNSGVGFFNNFRSFSVGALPTSMAVGDFNNDGFPDLAVSNRASDDITVLLNRTQVNKITDNPAIPKSYHLTAYPNPFNSNAVISFNQPKPGFTTLTIYDILGRQVETVHQGFLPAGTRDFTWQADKYPSGIYFALIKSPEITESVKLTLIK